MGAASILWKATVGVNPRNPVVGAGMDLTPLSRTTTTAVRNAVQPGWRNQAIAGAVLLHCAFGCLRSHSARASCNCAFHGPGVTPTLGSLRPRTILPNLTSSSSDIRRRRSRSFCNLDFAGFKSNGHLPVFRQRLGTQLYVTTGLRRRRRCLNTLKFLIFRALAL